MSSQRTEQQNSIAARQLAAAHPHLWRQTPAATWEYKRGDKWHGCVDNDPFSDLNAMHVMEKVLDQEQADVVNRIIGETVPATDSWADRHMWHADVATRAKALKEAFPAILKVSLESVIVDVAYIAGKSNFHSGDSRADVDTMIAWAKEFHAAIAQNNWTVSEVTYIASVETFTKHKLKEVGA